MSKKVAIVQSNYIPWKILNLINSVDEFILYDDGHTRRDWSKPKQNQTKKWTNG